MTSLIALASCLAQTQPSIAVNVDRLKAPISRNLYGIFFEEINQAGDGGVYAELLRNRGLETLRGNELPVGWTPISGVGVDERDGPNPAHPASIALEAGGAVANDGFWGVPVRKRDRYRLVVWIKGPGKLIAKIGSESVALGGGSNQWTRVEKTVTAVETSKGRIQFSAENGPAKIAYASLMPLKTWKGRGNGLRPDLAEHVSGMKPSFIRFPGGCYVEGGDRFEDAFDWKRSVGPVDERKGLAHSMWGYPNTFGLGYHEYLQWCEDLGAAPLFVVNCGINHRQTTPMEQMGDWVSYALDAIEYANGPVSSKWGALRAKNGHPKPFGLKYIEIGNENGGWFYGGNAAYEPRYRKIYDAIKAKHPEITTIADWQINEPMEMVDEHYYQDPAWFWRNAGRYDAYDRSGPKIYVGEYAVTRGCGQGNLVAALGEAAFMAGMERNADVVTMSSYAPLFVNVNNRQWNPNAIVFDADRSYGTPSYYTQALFANNRADQNVEVSFPAWTTPPPALGGGFGLIAWRTQAEFKDLEVETDGKTVFSSQNLALTGLKVRSGQWTVQDGVVREDEIRDDRAANFVGVDTTGAQKAVYRLKARKLAGDEGFIVVTDDKDGGSLNWNIGGWNNTQTAFQRNGDIVGRAVTNAPKIETGRWYDIRIEREGNRTRGYLDGKLVQEIVESGSPNFTAVAGIDRKHRELVMKIVNGSDDARHTRLDLRGASFGASGTVIVLTGPSLMAENSFDAPRLIAPRSAKLERVVPNMEYTFEPRSVTVLRIPIR